MIRILRSCHLFAVAGALALSACSGGDENAQGVLNLGLTDTPVTAAEKVVVAFTGIEVKPQGGPAFTVPVDPDACDTYDSMTQTCSIDVLKLQGMERRVVFSRNIDAGAYLWIRLAVDADQNEMDSYIEFKEGSQCSLWIPSGAETGLKLVSGITVTANGVSDYTADIDVRKSVTKPEGLVGDDPDPQACNENYLLKPVIRLVDTTVVGSVAGSVAGALLDGGGCQDLDMDGYYDTAAIYVFDDPDGTAVPDDIDDIDPDPVTSATVAWDDASMSYRYTAAYLLPGDYRLALTCTADVEDPNLDDTAPESQSGFAFIQDAGVTVEANMETRYDFTVDAN